MTYVAAVVPTIDEADTISELVCALDKTCDRVLVIDESLDLATFNAAEHAGAECRWLTDEMCQPLRVGLGGAYAEANEGCDRVPPDWHVVHIDAGGSHDPADVYPMLDLAEEGFDVVIGSRFCPGGEHHGPRRRRLFSRGAAAALNLISLQDIDDWTSGYRIYSPRARAVLAAHEFTTSGHAWQIEALWVCLQHGMRVVEHPIVYRSSVSHLSTRRVREAFRLYWALLKE